jgi:acyl transferase domain-containing protein
MQLAGGIASLVSTRQLLFRTEATPSHIPSQRWVVTSRDTAATYGSFLLGDLTLEYQTFGIPPHQARNMDRHFIVILEGADSVLKSCKKTSSGREQDIGVFVGILG